MRRALISATLLSVLALGAANAWAETAQRLPAADAPGPPLTLSLAYRAALLNDPTYKAAISERQAGETNRAIGLAGLLPQISASFNRTKNNGSMEQPGFDGTVKTHLNYGSAVNNVQLNQTVLNYGRVAELRQGYARASYAESVFDTKAKDTVVRLISRYFQALLSSEDVVLAQNKLEANEKQITITQRRYAGGDGTIIDVNEAVSRRDLSKADLIKAQDGLVVAQRQLQEMLGGVPTRLTAVKDDFKPQPLQPSSLQEWLDASLANNAEIRAGVEGSRIAELEVDRAFGGHLPSLDVIASHREVRNETLSTLQQKSTTNALGVQVNLPIFAGGLTSAQVSQAGFNRDRAGQELAATREKIAVDVTRQYQGVVSGAQRVDALLTAVKSSDESLKAIEKGFQAGTRSITDILDAEDRLFQAKRDLTQARLQYVLARLTLAGQAATLDAATIDAVSAAYLGPDQVIISQQ
jgi:protease secretion system outer membrane protein